MKIAIDIDASRLAFPLKQVTVGRLSSAEFALMGDVEDFAALKMTFSRVDSAGGESRDPVAAEARRRPAEGAWDVYASPFCFPDASEDLEYQVVGSDAQGNDRWLGTGHLSVRACGAAGSSATPPIVPADTYLRNPSTGLYHRLVAELDDDGNITVAVDQEGVEK